MEFGLFGINMGPLSDPGAAIKIARTAESAGFDSLWAGEHVVLPDPQVAPSPLPPTYPMLDPNICFAWLAGQTTTIRLGTGIIILPQRNPLVLAKEMASLDVLSNGRLIFGVGIGYLKAEFDALGIPFKHKAARTVEYLEAMQAIWSQETPSYQGQFVRFDGIQALPRPLQQPGGPPLVFGGHVAAAYERSVALAQGWYGFGLTLEKTAECLAGLRSAAERVERPPELGRLEISVTPFGDIDIETARHYAELGVDRLITLFPTQNSGELFSSSATVSEVDDYIKHLGDSVVGRV